MALTLTNHLAHHHPSHELPFYLFIYLNYILVSITNRICVYKAYNLVEANFDLWDQINIPKKGGYYYLSPCENHAHTFVLTLLGGDFSMTLNLTCPSNTSSHFSWITLYLEHAWSKSYWSFTSFLLNTFILCIICSKPNFATYGHAYCSLYDILVNSLHD